MNEFRPDEIIQFWLEAGPKLWFTRDDAFDARVRARWFFTHEVAARGGLDVEAGTPEGALPVILLLDQFPRNMFRGSARSFATDDKALAISKAAIARGFDVATEPPLKRFFYLPAMHSEKLEDQEFCLEKCRAAGDEDGVKFAIIHRDIIARFGRFPHRNTVLGRATTPEEQAFLDAGGFAG